MTEHIGEYWLQQTFQLQRFCLLHQILFLIAAKSIDESPIQPRQQALRFSKFSIIIQ